MITASGPSWRGPFTGLSPQQFNKLIAARTNLTLLQIARVFGVSKSAADRIVDHLGPALALRLRRRFRKNSVLIVDGTLVPTRDRTVAASSKNYRCSTNHQAITTAGPGKSPARRPPSAPPSQ